MESLNAGVLLEGLDGMLKMNAKRDVSSSGSVPSGGSKSTLIAFVLIFLLVVVGMVIPRIRSSRSSGESTGGAPNVEERALPEPQLTLDRTTHDFGALAQGETAADVFKITNTGDAPLILGVPSASCGCLTADLERRALDSGEETNLKLQIRADIDMGDFNYTVTLPYNGLSSTTAILEIQVKVRAPLLITPPLLRFGAVAKGEARVLPIQLRHAQGEAFRVLSAKSGREEYRVLPFDSKRVAVEHVIEVEARNLPDIQGIGGFSIGGLTIESTADKKGFPSRLRMIMQLK